MNTLDITLPSQQYKRKVTIFSIAVVVVAISCIYLGFNPIGFFTEFHFVRDLLGEMSPPNYRVLSDNSSTIYAILQTFSMAFLGTVYGGIFAIILAFLAASNTMPYKIVRWIVQFIVALIRVMPILVVVLIKILTQVI